MSNPCGITQPHYIRSLLQLLPRGYAWEWDENSAGRRVLAIAASELHRAHETLCGIADYNIERFAGGVTGWSAPDYERLLLYKFGLAAVVTDGLEPFTCESSCESALLDERIVYAYVVTVDNAAAVPDTVLQYLRQYQQSHTHYYLRDRRISAETLYDVLAFDCESECNAPLYERDWHGIRVYADPTYSNHELTTLSGWAAISSQFRAHTDFHRGGYALTN
ncbi:MAG: hypothetical protein BWK73_19140 [Thiothrix lacustris]|uniref:Uncharacterized protein n=1 Tax=Thiothrix lacustris TaxID=525917 RepID=A0A1Y1QPM8_9GAMM|nr:MAG: hypothetical protein BWK73_19140 [Thiothrix lacustris]